jgi:hypothetical protein
MEKIMAEMVERYVHQVGRYLPEKEREDILAELRSLIQDKLDDRFAGSPTPAEVASVLTDFGDPRQIAASYSGGQYLVGPRVYPYMVRMLRGAWILVPPSVVFLNVFMALVSSPEGTLFGLFIGTVFGTLEVTVIASAVIVLIFAIIEHYNLEIDEHESAAEFDPFKLPKVDDPASIDYAEIAIGMAISIFLGLIMFYFLRVEGLTLRFDLGDPGEVVPAPVPWMILFIINVFVGLMVQLMVLQRNFWTIGLRMTETASGFFGSIILYFVVFNPLFDHFVTESSSFRSIPLCGVTPAMLALLIGFATVASGAVKISRLWMYESERSINFSNPTNGEVTATD